MYLRHIQLTSYTSHSLSKGVSFSILLHPQEPCTSVQDIVHYQSAHYTILHTIFLQSSSPFLSLKWCSFKYPVWSSFIPHSHDITKPLQPFVFNMSYCGLSRSNLSYDLITDCLWSQYPCTTSQVVHLESIYSPFRCLQHSGSTILIHNLSVTPPFTSQ